MTNEQRIAIEHQLRSHKSRDDLMEMIQLDKMTLVDMVIHQLEEREYDDEELQEWCDTNEILIGDDYKSM